MPIQTNLRHCPTARKLTSVAVCLRKLALICHLRETIELDCEAECATCDWNGQKGLHNSNYHEPPNSSVSGINLTVA